MRFFVEKSFCGNGNDGAMRKSVSSVKRKNFTGCRYKDLEFFSVECETRVVVVWYQREQRERKEQEARIPPRQYFKETRPNAFSDFDDTGLPVTYADGTAVTKSQRDKMRKVNAVHMCYKRS